MRELTSSSRFDLVVFDLDGVLVDTSPCHRAAFEALWREIGITGPPYESLAGRTTLQAVRDCTRALAPTEGQFREWVLFKQERARVEIGRASCRERV